MFTNILALMVRRYFEKYMKIDIAVFTLPYDEITMNDIIIILNKSYSSQLS